MIHDEVQALLIAAEVVGPFVNELWPEEGDFRTMIRVEGRPGNDRQRQWERVGLTIFCRDPKRKVAETQAGKAHRALNMREAFMAGDLYVPWSECYGWPRLVGKDGEGNWTYRLEAELHLAYR